MTGWHWLLAVLAALLIGAGLVWWHDGTLPGISSTPSTKRPSKKSHEIAAPTLYRWVDAHGVVNITDHPPKGRRFVVVKIDPEQNIVPAASAEHE